MIALMRCNEPIETGLMVYRSANRSFNNALKSKVSLVATAPPTIKVEDYRIGKTLFRRIWRLTVPYWTRRAAWVSWGVYAMLFGTIGINSYLIIESSFAMKTLTDVLVAQKADAFNMAVMAYFFLSAAGFFIPMIMSVLDIWLSQNWRTWLTTRLVDQYLYNRTYYDIALAGDLDNPDQRIQENVGPFVNAVSSLPRTVVSQIAALGTGMAVLTVIDTRLTIVTIIFGLLNTLGIYFVTVPTIRQNFEVQVAEADLRHGLLHVRENAEPIAFYHGEESERVHILQRLRLAVRKDKKAQYYQFTIAQGVSGFFSLVWMVLPFIVLAPKVFSGDISYGSVTQATAIAFEMLTAITALTNFLPTIAAAAPRAVRLAHIQERLEQVNSRNQAASSGVNIVRSGDIVSLRNVSLETPRGEQSLICDLTLSVQTGENLVIVGQTGVGKSSLLRAMGGLWTRGSGTMEMPPIESCMFLPQRPYMILADLRSQILYPYGCASDEEIAAALHAVKLPDLLDKHGGLDAVCDWSKVLSLGEQQRVAFARVLICKPTFVFLDEATSAVDIAMENWLYRTLAQTGATYISVGHRLTILDHHTDILSLCVGGEWTVEPVQQHHLRGTVPAMV
jgi:vitamin B12/bleomycin/antimicrobial peptide transport system ATP-binding/permease protein